jgi:hypothetical protein
MKPSPERHRVAAALGAASGARSFAGAAALALRGRPRAGWARGAILALAAGEAVADKLPIAPARSEPLGLVGRLLGGASSGAAVAGRRGAAIGASFALATAYASERARALAGARTGLPDPALAVAEDLLTYSSAWLAAGHPEDGDDRLPIHAPGRDPKPPPLRAAAAGLAATVVGSAAMVTVQATYGKLTAGEPRKAPPVHLLLGAACGGPFGLLAARRPGPGAGLLLGASVWALALAEPPLRGAAPPWERPSAELGADLGFRLVYGFASGAAFAALSA